MTRPDPTLADLPNSYIRPRALDLAYGYDTDGHPFVALILDGHLAVQLPDAALAALIPALAQAPADLAAMALVPPDA